MQNVIINADPYLEYDFDKCKFENYGIFAYQYNLCQINKPDNCKVSFVNICQICYDNYELSQNNLCIPQCGNGIIQEYEICDDVNSLQFDGCYQCQNSCQVECLQCNNTQCFKCIEGWNLINFKCIAECGDGLVALNSQEQCDDQNDESNDGCYECKFECDLNCLFCNHNLDCLQCQNHFHVQNLVCIPVCGDGIIIEGFEQCDDGNIIENDGCHQCQFSSKNICEHGYYFIDLYCQSICGDTIIASNEQCDDGDELPFDGCYNCEFSCSQNCFDCVDGKCLKCENGYQIMNGLCIDICGNGYKSGQEECDDNNQISRDGCSDVCEIEINWTCSRINFQTSSCFYIKPPHFSLILLNQIYDSYYVQLKISSNVKLEDSQSNFTQSLKAHLNDIDPSHYIIYQKVLVEPNFVICQNINYIFQIRFLQIETSELYFQVQFETSLIDQYGIQVENSIFKLHLRNLIVITQQQKISSQKMSSFNMYMLIGLAISSFIILLSGNPTECLEILDALQDGSYFF
ncbi:unnamed protein product [Paramecium octaurelia]|uniref:Uncharacterized protein n=1 Tax=Paramecium octaurelia TaxID=43137 RepID=A0A8S1WUA6_PAROT|nr:unnamed protein product [Paramecium octaurelia]